jgi:acyl-CoA thioester hydrolase
MGVRTGTLYGARMSAVLHEVSMQWFVGYGDADAFGMVLWARYAEWAARANSLLWKEHRDDPPDTGVVRSVHVEYTAPARFEDVLTVKARYVKAGRTSFSAEITFDRPDGQRVAVAMLGLVSIDPSTGLPVEVPAWLRALPTSQGGC